MNNRFTDFWVNFKVMQDDIIGVPEKEKKKGLKKF